MKRNRLLVVIAVLATLAFFAIMISAVVLADKQTIIIAIEKVYLFDSHELGRKQVGEVMKGEKLRIISRSGD